MAKYKKLLSVILCDDCSKAFKIFKKIDDTLITNGYILEKNNLYCRIKGKGAELYFVSRDNFEEFKEKVGDPMIINDVINGNLCDTNPFNDKRFGG